MRGTGKSAKGWRGKKVYTNLEGIGGLQEATWEYSSTGAQKG